LPDQGRGGRDHPLALGWRAARGVFRWLR
jgi:hypothetical protein